MPSAIGQPFEAGEFELSLGSPNAAAGTPASNGVIITAAGDIAPTIVLSLAGSPSFDLTTLVRVTARFVFVVNSIGSDVDDCTVTHNIQNIETGVPLLGSPFPGGDPVLLAAAANPVGDAPPLGGGVKWYEAKTGIAVAAPSITTPPVGTYRILTLVRNLNLGDEALVAAFLDTYLMVTP